MALNSRQKLCLMFLAIAIAIWAFDRFYYTPQKANISRLRAQVQMADRKLRESVIFATSVERLEAEVSRLEGEFQGLRERTLEGEEFRTFLKHLARQSDRLQMKIVSLVPQEAKIAASKEKREAATFHYKKVSVHMVLHSTYGGLGTYLKRVEELPFLITVDRLQIEREEEIFPLLKATVGLGIYIISL